MYRSYVDRHENDVINNALLRAVRNGNPRNPLRGPICIFNTVDRTKLSCHVMTRVQDRKLGFRAR